MSRNKRSVDYQLDLTPFISLLSVCICFLLLTVTWFQVGALSVKQVMGVSSSADQIKSVSKLWVYMKSKKQIEVHLKKSKNTISRKVIKASELDWNFKEFYQHIARLKKQHSSLSEVFILPEANVIYQDIIKVMDKLRQEGLFSIGLAPI